MTLRIFVPGDAAAVAVGADDVAAALAREAASSALDIRIVRNGSRGLFWLETLVEVETPDGRIGYGPVEAADIPDIVAAGLFEGRAHRLCVGRPEQIPFLARQTRLTFARCGVIDPASLEDYLAHEGYVGLQRAVAAGPAGVIDAVTQSGLRGRGGAGFPTGIKWKTAADAPGSQKYIVCNADEGDSGTYADRMLMEGDPFLLIEGMTIAALAVGATRGFIYIRSEYPHAIAAMDRAAATARQAGLLGANVADGGFAFDLEIRVGAGAYVCGEETALLDSLEG
jgi:formate dehydrogenase iron-sulfur subunit